jgi:hypothetical protein
MGDSNRRCEFRQPQARVSVCRNVSSYLVKEQGDRRQRGKSFSLHFCSFTTTGTLTNVVVSSGALAVIMDDCNRRFVFRQRAST